MLFRSIIGMGVVFGVLILLWLTLEMMQLFFSKKKADKPAEAAVKHTVQQMPSLATAEVDDTGELIAIVSAAIAASLGTTVGSLKISAIRKIEGGNILWSKVGKNELINKSL